MCTYRRAEPNNLNTFENRYSKANLQPFIVKPPHSSFSAVCDCICGVMKAGQFFKLSRHAARRVTVTRFLMHSIAKLYRLILSVTIEDMPRLLNANSLRYDRAQELDRLFPLLLFPLLQGFFRPIDEVCALLRADVRGKVQSRPVGFRGQLTPIRLFVNSAQT